MAVGWHSYIRLISMIMTQVGFSITGMMEKELCDIARAGESP
jgi:hypothetical protein